MRFEGYKLKSASRFGKVHQVKGICLYLENRSDLFQDAPPFFALAAASALVFTQKGFPLSPAESPISRLFFGLPTRWDGFISALIPGSFRKSIRRLLGKSSNVEIDCEGCGDRISLAHCAADRHQKLDKSFGRLRRPVALDQFGVKPRSHLFHLAGQPIVKPVPKELIHAAGRRGDLRLGGP